MKATILLLVSVLLPCVPAAAAPAGPAAAVFEIGDPAFKERFKKAMADKKPAEMTRLVKDDEREAELWIVRACEVLADRADPEEEAFFTAIHDAWKTAFKCEFPVRYREWFKGLDAAARRERKELVNRWDKVRNEFVANKEARDGFAFLQILEEVEQLGAYFEQVGDQWHSSEAWLVYAACLDEALRGESADFSKAARGYEYAIAAREKFDCKDGAHADALKRKEELAKKLAGAEAPAGDSGKGGDAGGGKPADPAAPAAPVDLGPPLKTPLAFEPLSSVEQFVRPYYFADEIFAIWNPIQLKGNGSTSPIPRVEGAPLVHRVGTADVRMDVDGDGKGDGKADEKVPMTNTSTPVRVMLGQGETARPWAFFAYVGGNQENYQGVTMNLEATKEQVTIYVLSAASVVGNVAGTQIRLIDDTSDGKYGEEPQTYGYVGLTSGTFQPDLDSMVIGAGKRARPWSEQVEIGGKWYKLEEQLEGRELTAAPIAPETGVLKLDYKGGTAPAYVILRGTGDLKNCYFDLVEGGAKGVTVPVGRYQLFYGEVRKGKKKQVQKAVILPGKAGVNYDVKRGGTTTVTLGAPFKFDFALSKTDEGLATVQGRSVCVVGSAGERYERSWNCVPRPEIFWRKKGTKAPSKPVRMPFMMDSNAFEKMGWEASWFPLDAEVDTKEKGEVEFQLADKKHDLFGKVESDWKE